MKFKVPFQFGDKVRIKALLRKASERLDSGKTFRFWKRYSSVNVIGLYLGYRNLYDGTIESGDYNDEDGGGFYSYLKPTKTHRAALICIKGHKPEYVFLDDLEKIDE